ANVPFSDSESPALRAARQDAILMGDAQRAAWEEWIAAECAAAPVLLVLEDLHWGDVPTIKLIDGALRNLKASPQMVLALARPEVKTEFEGLWAGRGVHEIRLDGLTRKASERLVTGALEGVSDENIRRVVERAEGNPFYIEELLRAVVSGSSDVLP